MPRRQLKHVAGLTSGIVLVIAVSCLEGIEHEPTRDSAAATDVAAIISTTEAYAKAYHAADAQGLANLFTSAGEMADSTGNLFQGRDAIREEFAAYFDEVSGCRRPVDDARRTTGRSGFAAPHRRPLVPTDVPPTGAIARDNLWGTWVAAGPQGSTFEFTLSRDGTFVWTFAHARLTRTIRGVYALDGTTLALEPQTGGVMLGEISNATGESFTVHMAGRGTPGQGLTFRRK